MLGDLSIPHVPWVLTESPRPWGMLRCGRDCAGGSVGQLLGCWNERAAAVSVSPKQAEGRGCTCREGLGEEQQGDAEELWQSHRNLLLWLPLLQSFVGKWEKSLLTVGMGGMTAPERDKVAGSWALGWVSAAISERRCQFCTGFPQAGASAQLNRGRPRACQCLFQISWD